jgi:hypothetical protein
LRIRFKFETGLYKKRSALKIAAEDVDELLLKNRTDRRLGYCVVYQGPEPFTKASFYVLNIEGGFDIALHVNSYQHLLEILYAAFIIFMGKIYAA